MSPELLLRGTIWLSVLAWAASEVLRRTGADRREAARAMFTAGALLLIGHTVTAFQMYHGWSHVAAYTETARRSEEMVGVASGWGLYLNYLFIATWTADAGWWWARPHIYLQRSRVIDTAVFAFFAFMFVNGAVVFAATPMRIAGAAAVLAAVVARAMLPSPRLGRTRA